MEYFQNEDNYLWFENKKVNDTHNPQVLILRDPNDQKRKKIVFTCQIPLSDVYLSLNGDEKAFKPAHTHPLPKYRVTVSALHVSLNFMQIESLNVNLNKQINENDAYTLINHPSDFKEQDILPKKSAQRFFVYFDSRCQNCSLKNDSLFCKLKVKINFFVLKNSENF